MYSSSSSNGKKTRWKIKTNYTVRYSTSECNEVLNFMAMDQETISLDSIVFQSVTKIS